MALSLCLQAKNSSGMQHLIISTTDSGVAITLAGDINGDRIQVDFDELTYAEANDFISLLEHRITK